MGIAGAYNSPARFSSGDGAGYRRTLSSFIECYDEELPAIAPGGGLAAMGGDEPLSYYGTERSAAPSWENRVTYGSPHALMTFDALGAAPLLADTPLLVVHGRTDAYCAPALAEALRADATGPAEIVWLDAERHVDLYDVVWGEVIATVRDVGRREEDRQARCRGCPPRQTGPEPVDPWSYVGSCI